MAAKLVSGQVATEPETEHPPAPSASTSVPAPGSESTTSVPEAAIASWFVSPGAAAY